MRLDGLVVGSVGVKLKLKCKTGTKVTDPVLSLADFTNVYLDVRKPNATSGEEGTVEDVVWEATIEEPAADGYISYTLQAGDLDIAGPYTIQPRFEQSGQVLKGSAATLYVQPLFRT